MAGIKNIKWVKFLVIAVVGLFVLSLLKNALVKSVVTLGASKVTGAPVRVGGFALGIPTQSVRIKDFKLYHPKGFDEGVMVDISEIRVDYDLPALLGGELHLPMLVLDLKEMVVIRDAEGNLNVDALKVAQGTRKSEEAF